MAYDFSQRDVMCGRTTKLIIFSIRWEMASWPILLDASLRIAKVVL